MDIGSQHPRIGGGKVRELYDAGEDRLLIVTTDRISAFDIVLPASVPRKGEVLTQITAWWLERLAEISPNHLITAAPGEIIREVPGLESVVERYPYATMLVRRTRPVPIECVVRGYLSGSAWGEYRESGTLAGEPLPEGLIESGRLEPPIFSPATKAEEGHDENITFTEVVERVGLETALALRDRSLALYSRAREIAEGTGLIIADTKFEFGHLEDGDLILIDEVLTPDSSRFWPLEGYAPGRPQPSFDKQPVRDHLEGLAERGLWSKSEPGPELPEEVVLATSERYLELFERLVGMTLDEWEADRYGG